MPLCDKCFPDPEEEGEEPGVVSCLLRCSMHYLGTLCPKPVTPCDQPAVEKEKPVRFSQPWFLLLEPGTRWPGVRVPTPKLGFSKPVPRASATPVRAHHCAQEDNATGSGAGLSRGLPKLLPAQLSW